MWNFMSHKKQYQMVFIWTGFMPEKLLLEFGLPLLCSHISERLATKTICFNAICVLCRQAAFCVCKFTMTSIIRG